MAKLAETRTVRLAVDITVNVEDWLRTFGGERRNVPWDVRQYFFGLIRDAEILNGEVESQITLKN